MRNTVLLCVASLLLGFTLSIRGENQTGGAVGRYQLQSGVVACVAEKGVTNLPATLYRLNTETGEIEVIMGNKDGSGKLTYVAIPVVK